MTALDRVIANPRSLGARYSLLREWEAGNDPRAELLDYQLRQRKGRWELWSPISDLIRDHGRQWAGRVADLVDHYKFHLGLVGEVTLSGEKFLEIGAELFELAPIQHVNLQHPFGPIESIANSPLITRLTSLGICGAKAEFGDAGARVIAAASAVSHLWCLSLNDNEITRAGVEALAASKYLAKAKYVGLEGNPADPTPFDAFWKHEPDVTVNTWRLPDLAIELKRKFGPRPWLERPTDGKFWPDWYEWALDYDYIPERALVLLENRAADLDKRTAAAGDNEEAIKEVNQLRAQLLRDLSAENVLTGDELDRLQLRECPTLSTYHGAAEKLLSYLLSPERDRFFPGQQSPVPDYSNISLDWFRYPSGYLPDDSHVPGEKVSPYDWLALCERNFIDPMPNGTGERFVRLQGKIHILHYRMEDGPTPRLWRALPNDQPIEGLSKAQQFAHDVLEEMDKPMSKEREEYEARKEQEDRIGYLQLYLKTGQITAEEIVEQAVTKLIREIEKLGPLEKFDKIEVPLLVANQKAALLYTPSTSAKNLHRRYVQLAVWTKSCQTTFLDTGTHEEMLAYLRRPTIVAEVIKTGRDSIISDAMITPDHQSEYYWEAD
jgi:hypothetical protein